MAAKKCGIGIEISRQRASVRRGGCRALGRAPDLQRNDRFAGRVHCGDARSKSLWVAQGFDE